MGNKPPQVSGSRPLRSSSILDASFYNADESKWEKSVIQFEKGRSTVDYGSKNAVSMHAYGLHRPVCYTHLMWWKILQQFLERINLNMIQDIQPITFEDNQYMIKFYEFVGLVTKPSAACHYHMICKIRVQSTQSRYGRPNKEHVFKTSDSDGAKQFHEHM